MRTSLRACGLVVELDGFQLDLGVLVLFRVEEETPFAFVEIRPEPGKGIHPGVQLVGVCPGRSDVANDLIAAESSRAATGNDARQQHHRCDGLGERLPGKVALVRSRTIDHRAGGVEVLQTIRAGSVGDLAVRRAHQRTAAVHRVQHGAEQSQGAARALKAAALRDALEDQLDKVGEKRKGMLHPFDVRILRRDTELAPRVDVRAHNGAGRIAIVCVRVGEQTVPNDGGAITGVAESQFNSGVRFSVEPGSRSPSYTAANNVIRRSRLASSLNICRNARF